MGKNKESFCLNYSIGVKYGLQDDETLIEIGGYLSNYYKKDKGGWEETLEFHMKKVTLRQYRDSDKDAVWRLHVAGLNQTGSFIFNQKLDGDFKDIEGIYMDNGGEFFVASLNEEIAGMGALRKINSDTAEIKRIRVDTKYQRKGLGSIILKRLIERAKELSYKKLILDTSTKQFPAHKLYEKHGFTEFKRDMRGDHGTIFYKLEI